MAGNKKVYTFKVGLVKILEICFVILVEILITSRRQSINEILCYL